MSVVTKTLLLVALVVAALAAAPAIAINTDGRYKSPFDPLDDPSGVEIGISGAPYGAHRMGAPAGNSYGGGSTWQSSPVSYWALNVDSGSYGLQFANRDQWPRMALYNISAGTTYLRVVNNPDYLQGASGYYANPATSFAQQFQARGTSVTSVACRFPVPTTAIAIIHSGDLSGPQIGPSRVLQGTYTNDSMACWSAGEVPTVPGQFYTVEFRKADSSSLQIFYSRARCLMGEDFPGGKSWVAGAEVPNPLRLTVGMDTDGMTSTVNTSMANSQIAYDFIPSVAGQTFTAKGTSVLGIHFLGAASNGYEVGVFHSPGADGMGVGQIGPLKSVKSNTDRCVGVWFPGEVPVTAGQSYYIRIRSTSGGYALYHTLTNEYSGGTEYIGGTAKAYDLTCTILEETSSGSATKDPVGFSNLPAVTTTTTSATINWITPVAATATVEYGKTTPYASSVTESFASTVHAVTLGGLEPNTLYHARIRLQSPVRRDTYSRDIVFVTGAVTPNLLANPGFETGNAAGWTTFGNVTPPVKSSDIGGLAPRSGSYFLGAAYGSNPAPWCGAYQRVSVDQTRSATFRGWLFTYQLFGFSADAEHMVLGQIGIDPYGGTDPNSSNIRWSPLTSAQNWWGPAFESRYQELALTTQPQSGYVTVFMRAGQPNLGSNPSIIAYVIFGWDDMRLCQAVPATNIQTPGAARDLTDGTLVSLQNVIVSASSAQAGANYVQDPKRSSGIRCESASPFAPGRLVTVMGTLATKASGERYIAGAVVTSDAPGTPAVALGAKNGTLGTRTLDNAGPGNVGLVMRTWGIAEPGPSGYFYINDGSSDARVKVNTSSLTASPVYGRYYEITGIVQLEGTAPSATLLLRPRSDGDVKMID